MGLFSSIKKNLARVIRDVAPIGAIAAQIALPGLGGAVAANIIRAVGVREGRPVAARRSPVGVAIPRCPPPGIPGNALNSRFQSRNFRSGGSTPGRVASRFIPRSVVGRRASPPIPRRLPAVSACPCPPSAAFRRF